MILREFLYVDTDKVRSLLAQRDGGIVEEIKSTAKEEGRGGIGIRNVANREGMWGKEESTSKSAVDAIFPMLEDDLESQGFLADISDRIEDVTSETFHEFMEEYPAGSFIRLTGSGRLFDARYVTQVLAGIGAVVQGLVEFNPDLATNTPGNADTRRPATKGRPAPPKQRNESAEPAIQLEDSIPNFPHLPLLGFAQAANLKALVRIARGMFNPGLHMRLDLGTDESIGVTARLQEGRRFLDSDPEVLFARYGTEAQDWTIVGTIGMYAHPEKIEDDATFVDEKTGHISRSATLRSINDVMRNMGSLGMADFPSYPGFSIVPFAVYRPIPKLVDFEGRV
ncbi:hypothetical protein ABZ814_12880 [Micromonospora musae]|uniref:DUF6414 family protein n=1 Tax=Micromonospora musae TaxID=1894970 RepID=UPI0033D7DF64